MSPLMVVVVSAGIIVLSAFFVATEFALIAARRHRLEEDARRSRAARAALRSSAELTLLLAGAQLGITVCTLALGAITKPAVHHALTPMLESVGLGDNTASVIAFVLALLIVTFLHLVIGEMAPKSWAIAHPEFVATVLALPMRAFMRFTRPLLYLLNEAANRLLRMMGVEPIAELPVGGDPATLSALVEHSANVGALEAGYRASISRALVMDQLTLGDLVAERTGITSVPGDATVADVQEATRRTGHMRVLLRDDDAISGVIHVRDTLTNPLPDAPAAPYSRPVLAMNAKTPLHQALARMRETRNQLVLVTGESGAQPQVVTLTDILPSLLPRVTLWDESAGVVRPT